MTSSIQRSWLNRSDWSGEGFPGGTISSVIGWEGWEESTSMIGWRLDGVLHFSHRLIGGASDLKLRRGDGAFLHRLEDEHLDA